VCVGEERDVAARAFGESAQREPARQVVRCREPLERLAATAGVRGEELEHRVAEAEPELVPVRRRWRDH